jgi:hypothetical protein
MPKEGSLGSLPIPDPGVKKDIESRIQIRSLRPNLGSTVAGKCRIMIQNTA